MARGRKKVDRTSWLKPGGSLPAKPTGLTKEEQAHYAWIREALEWVSMGGRADLMLVMLAARVAARADVLRAIVAANPPTAADDRLHPAWQELSRTESRLRDILAALYLAPRTRGSTRLPAESQAGAQLGDDGPSDLLKILG
jgi:hypothetical protein